MTDERPLSGIKVCAATQGVAGPHSTMLMAQHGADVIKVEPLDGDWGRTLGKVYGDHCAHSVIFNRGKRSIAIDLKVDEGRALAQQLARDADVVVESFRPGVMSRFGLGYDDVRKDNPDVIYLSVTGFGQGGPNRDLPVTDAVIQAFSGLMSINRDERYLRVSGDCLRFAQTLPFRRWEIYRLQLDAKRGRIPSSEDRRVPPRRGGATATLRTRRNDANEQRPHQHHRDARISLCLIDGSAWYARARH